MQRTVNARDRERINTNWNPRMSTAQNRRVAEELFARLSAGDIAGALEAESYGELADGRVWRRCGKAVSTSTTFRRSCASRPIEAEGR